MHTFAARFIVWIAAEVFLTVIGADDLADCGEWVFEKQQVSTSKIEYVYA